MSVPVTHHYPESGVWPVYQPIADEVASAMAERVLVLQTQPAAAKTLAVFFEKRGATVLLVDTGHQAIELLADDHPIWPSSICTCPARNARIFSFTCAVSVLEPRLS